MVIETGLSDFHKLHICTMYHNFHKQKPIIVKYRNYKYFNNDHFQNELLYQINKKGFQDIECNDFELLFMATLNKHAPLKTKYIRANNSPFMNKMLAI